MFKEQFMQTIQNKHLTAYKVAKETGISQGLMNEYKNGIKLPTIQNLIKIADYLDCSIDYLLGRTDYPELIRKDERGKLISFEGVAPNTHTIKIAGRDGSFREIKLTDDQQDLLLRLIDQLPDADNL